MGPALLGNRDGDILIMFNVAVGPGTGHLDHIRSGRGADLGKAGAGGQGHGSKAKEHHGECGEDGAVAFTKSPEEAAEEQA